MRDDETNVGEVPSMRQVYKSYRGKGKGMDEKSPSYSLSQKGARFLGAWEGYRAEPYNDSRMNATIGIGHLIHYGPVTPADIIHWGKITYPHALALLQADVYRTSIPYLIHNVKVSLTTAQIDALISLAFNCGPASLRAEGSVMLAVNSKPKRWNPLQIERWHSRIRIAFMNWAHPSELTRRRQSEFTLFNTGKYFTPANQYSNANG